MAAVTAISFLAVGFSWGRDGRPDEFFGAVLWFCRSRGGVRGTKFFFVLCVDWENAQKMEKPDCSGGLASSVDTTLIERRYSRPGEFLTASHLTSGILGKPFYQKVSRAESWIDRAAFGCSNSG
ncbi:MAG: hypothetical protein ACRD22_09695 [Terriglobia bacterium]